MLQGAKNRFLLRAGLAYWRAGQSLRDLFGVRLRSDSLVTPGRGGRAAASCLSACGLSIVLAHSVLAGAQNVVSSGALSGRITDQTGAVVAGASVDARSLETGVTLHASSNHVGLYRFPVVAPGAYSIAVSSKSFRDAQVLVRVLVGNTTSQDFKLHVGAGADTVRVAGTTPLLRPEESSSSTVIDRSLI